MTGSPVKVLGKVDVRVRLGLLEFSHQMLVADIVDEVILGTDIMNAYGVVVDLRGNVLKAVSYTHLDVYKRQKLSLAQNFR